MLVWSVWLYLLVAKAARGVYRRLEIPQITPPPTEKYYDGNSKETEAVERTACRQRQRERKRYPICPSLFVSSPLIENYLSTAECV